MPKRPGELTERATGYSIPGQPEKGRTLLFHRGLLADFFSAQSIADFRIEEIRNIHPRLPHLCAGETRMSVSESARMRRLSTLCEPVSVSWRMSHTRGPWLTVHALRLIGSVGGEEQVSVIKDRGKNPATPANVVLHAIVAVLPPFCQRKA